MESFVFTDLEERINGAVTPRTGETASMFVARELRNRIARLYIECMSGSCLVPLRPVSVFSQTEIDSITDQRFKIFCAYFSVSETKLQARINFQPEKDFDYLLVGIYHIKNGMDEQLSSLLEQRPELFIFLLPDFFTALFTPYLPDKGYQKITIIPEHPDYPLMVFLDNELHYCLDTANLLHNSPLLRDITFHMSINHKEFREEIQRHSQQ